MQSEVLNEKKSLDEGGEKYLFVCTGNTCRSPMAAAVFTRLYKDEGMTGDSCGLSAGLGAEMSENARTALESIGISGGEHRSKPVTEELLEESALIIGMTATHAQRLMMAFPQYARKITAMPIDIEDPYGGDLEVYKLCLSQICEAMNIGFAGCGEDEDH